jgi:hypothetical protein
MTGKKLIKAFPSRFPLLGLTGSDNPAADHSNNIFPNFERRSKTWVTKKC